VPVLIDQGARRQPSDVDASWLTSAFQHCGIARGCTVTAARFEGYIGTGQVGSTARFSLTWDGPGRPASVVAKFPSRDPAAAQAAFDNGTYRKEWTFYTAIAPTVSVPAPRCYAAGYTEQPQALVLLLEDLHSSQPGDQLAGLAPDDVAAALSAAVGLHAPRWGDPAIDGLLQADALSVAQRAERLSAYYAMTLESCLDRLEQHVDADIAALARRFAASVGAWAAGTDTPRTVVHYDLRADNLLFGLVPDAPPVAVVDWQTVGPGLAATDVAYLIGGSFPPEQRARLEGALVRQYRAELDTAGVRYGEADCWRDYRLGSLWGVIITVIATVVAARTDRGDALFANMLQRHGRHALDLDALSLCPPDAVAPGPGPPRRAP
jgi:hypothetical protein